MKRFCFLVHPLMGLARRLGAIPSMRPGLLLGAPPCVPEDVGRVARVGFDDVEGWIMSVPLLADELLADQSLALRGMERAVQEAAPVHHVGLGSVLAVVAGRGGALQEACGLPVTTGSAATAWAASAITRRVARARGLGRVAVLGARGGTGRAVAEVLRADLDVIADPASVRGFGLVVGCSSTGATVDPADLDPGAVVVDVALPRTLLGPPRRDVIVLAGESVRLARGWRRDFWGWWFHLLAGYGSGSVYACLLEPLLAARQGRGTPFAQGRRVEVEAVREVGRLAQAAGFTAEIRALHGNPRRLIGAAGRDSSPSGAVP